LGRLNQWIETAVHIKHTVKYY